MKNEISIYVKTTLPHTPADIESWHLLDTDKVSFTIDYVSNILSDIGSISSSRTYTVSLPRTVNNDKVLDLAVVPQYESRSRYKYLPCKCYVNDIDMTGDAYLYLLDSDAAHYQCCIVFGLLQYYRDWLDAGKTLKELDDLGQAVPWDWRAAFYDIYVPAGSTHDTQQYPPVWYGDDPNIDTYTPQNGLGRLMHYGIYIPGFDRTDNLVNYANVHPFVTVREIWERIISENNLNFLMPEDVLHDMEDLAIVLTTVSGNAVQGNPNADNNVATDHPDTVRLSAALKFGWNIICSTIGDCYQNGNAYNSTKGKILYKGDSGAVDLVISMLLEDTSSFSYNGGHQSASYILDDVGHMEYLNLCVYVYATQQTITLTPTYTPIGILWQGTLHIPCWNAVEGDAIADIWIDNDGMICNYCEGAFNAYWMLGRDEWDRLFRWAMCSVGVQYYTGTYIYPHKAFRCFPNLPDMSQLDFVKMVCQLYGLFPVVNSAVSDQVDFVPFDTLVECIPKAYDWSSRLLEEDTDAPNKIAFRLGDFARHNIIAYKEDVKDPVSDDVRMGSLNVDDLTLDREKELFTFPLAATEDNFIYQYNIKTVTDDSDPPIVTYEAEFIECVHRLMRVISWYNYANKTVTRLSFAGLTVPQIIEKYYTTYQTYIRQPRLITERVRMMETELNSIDMRVPVYLAKYGRYFAIKDIKWTVGNDYAECELLML